MSSYEVPAHFLVGGLTEASWEGWGPSQAGEVMCRCADGYDFLVWDDGDFQLVPYADESESVIEECGSVEQALKRANEMAETHGGWHTNAGANS